MTKLKSDDQVKIIAGNFKDCSGYVIEDIGFDVYDVFVYDIDYAVLIVGYELEFISKADSELPVSTPVKARK